MWTKEVSGLCDACLIPHNTRTRLRTHTNTHTNAHESQQTQVSSC